MCANYTPPSPARIKAQFDVDYSGPDYPEEIYPGYLAPIIRLSDDGSANTECVSACFGMVPVWAHRTLARHTYNARSETVASKPSFRHAYSKRQLCIVPAETFFEPNYESGRAVRWKIQRDDHSLLGIAGLWEWRPHGGTDDQPLLSFTMLTINAQTHPVMRHFHRPEDEKRMLVLLEPAQYQGWLHARPAELAHFLHAYPAEKLITDPAPSTRKLSARPPKAHTQPRGEPRSLWEED